MAKVKRECFQCEKEFTVFPSQIKKGGGKFCSLSCGTTYRNIHNNPTKDPNVRKKISKNHADVSGKNNPMYGMRNFLAPSFIDGRSQYNVEPYRRIALDNIEHKCKLCSEDDVKRLDVHHKDGNHNNNDIDNLIFLCRKCHVTKAHKYKRNKKGTFIGSELNMEVIL